MYARIEHEGRSQDETLALLRAKMTAVQGRRLETPVHAVLPALSSILPGGGLKRGATYAVPSAASGAGVVSLLLAMVAQPTQDGAWCAVVGMPEVGIEAARHLGVDLTRLVLVPDPGPRWLAIVATLAEVFSVVVVRPSSRVSDAETSRLSARLRDRDASLLVAGSWPGSEAVIDVADPAWEGVGEGHGYLSGRAVTVAVSGRRASAPKRARLLLPDSEGHVSAAEVLAPVVAMREAG